MADVFLNQQSLNYLTEIGTTDWSQANLRALATIDAATTTVVDPEDEAAIQRAVDYFIDFNNDDWANHGGPSAERFWGDATDIGEIYKTNEVPFSDAVARLFCDLLLRNGNEQARNGDLYDLLAKNSELDYPPPALAITTLGKSTSRIATFTTGLDPTTPRADLPAGTAETNEERAMGFAQDWFEYALVNHKEIPEDLLQAYIDLDPVKAKERIAAYLEAGIAGGGTVYSFQWAMPAPGTSTLTIEPPYVHEDLLAAYKLLSADTPSSADAGSEVTFSTDFQDPPPVVKGWEYYATWTLQQQAEARLPLDPGLLNDLDTSNPDAAYYVRWQALMQQAGSGTLDPNMLATLQLNRPDAAVDVCIAACETLIARGQNLNETYLNFIASRAPGEAERLCVESLDAALQPVNQLVYSATTSTTADNAVIRVQLSSMGTPLPVAGDRLVIGSDRDPAFGSSIPTGDANPSGYVVITAGDIALGYKDVQLPPLSVGENNVFSTFTHVVSTVTSPSSAPVLKEALPLMEFTVDLAGMGTTLPVAGDVVTVYGEGTTLVGRYTVTEADVQNGYIRATAPSSNTGWISGFHSITASFTHAVTTTSAASVPLPVTVDNALAIVPVVFPPPRPLDPVAMKALQTLHPSLANDYLTQFTSNGFAGGTTGTGGTGTGTGTGEFAQSIPEALMGAIERVKAIDQQIGTYFENVRAKTETLNKVNQMLAVANTAMGQMPLNAKPTDKLVNGLSPSQYNDFVTTFNAMSLDLKLGITITNETSKSDLEGYIQTLKSSSDALNNTNQLDLITVQNLSNQKQVMMQLVSTIMSSTFESLMKIIQKM